MPQYTIQEADKQSQWQSFLDAKDCVLQVFKEAANTSSKEQQAIFETYCMMLSDPDFLGQVQSAFESAEFNIEFVLNEKVSEFANILAIAGDEYLTERANDIKDVYNRVLAKLLNIEISSISEIPQNSIIVAEYINPSDAMFLEDKAIKGIVTTEGGKKSHLAILANNYGIPFVYGIEDVYSKFKVGDFAIIDGENGQIFVEPDNQTLEKYKDISEINAIKERQLAEFAEKPAVTKDGVKITINANIGNDDEVPFAIQSGADGIGLFRSEFLFMAESKIDEESQFLAYKNALECAKGKSVTIRTLDVGGDKIVKGISPEKQEQNPLLGWRAIRYCLDNVELFKTQLRALYRASIYGNLRIMIPLITCIEQVFAVKKVILEVQESLTLQNLPFNKDVPFGIMIETPAAAVCAELLASECNFFSIGTNDLTQYTLCVDRENTQVSPLFTEFSPSVIRMIKNTIEAAKNTEIDCSVCGELAGSKEGAILLIGLGITKLSVSPKKINALKAMLLKLTMEQIKTVVEEAIELKESSLILQRLENFVG